MLSIDAERHLVKFNNYFQLQKEIRLENLDLVQHFYFIRGRNYNLSYGQLCGNHKKFEFFVFILNL